MTNRKTNRKNNASPQARRLTIALLIEVVSASENQYCATIWNGIADAAQERGVNLICFAGGTLRASPVREIEVQRNMLYNLVDRDNVDGLVISGGSLSSQVSAREFQAFCDRYRPLPMVNIGAVVDGIPSVMIDNVSGLRGAVSHLIETHGYRRLACILGPERSSDAMERYRTYAETMTEHGLAVDPDLVVPGEFARSSGAAAMRILLDERQLRPGVDFEAVVSVNDSMAMGALDVLRARGIQVPYQVAIIGFDDMEEARVSTPPLTTVRQPMREQAKQAVDMLLAKLAGEDVPEQIVLPAELVVRQSCGCHSQTVSQVATLRMATPGDSTGEAFEHALAARHDDIVDAMVQAVVASSAKAASAATLEWAAQVLDGFAAGMRDETPDGFLLALDRVLREVVAERDDLSVSPGQRVAAWQGAVSALRHQALATLGDGETLARAEDLWQQARLFMAETALQAQRYRELRAEQQIRLLQEIGQAVVTTFDVGELMDAMARELPRLDIPSSYLSLYVGEGRPPRQSRLILAYDQTKEQYPGGRIELASGGQQFPSRMLAPEGMLPQGRCYSMVAEPLHFQDAHLGFALFEAGPRDGMVYELLRGQLSSALQAALLTQQIKRRALQIQTAAEVSGAASGILDPDQLIQQVVDLVQERFELRYVGLFLVSTSSTDGEPGDVPRRRWAVLRAGTGGVGKKMLAAGHRLKVDGFSKVGWCILNRQACFALDVASARSAEPEMEEGCSDLALPLISRGEVIGALEIQSTREAAFGGEDVTALQTMAGQLANAIVNARLYDQSQKMIAERKQAEAKLARSNQELEHFAYVASHDLQEPLRMVTGYLELLERRYKGQLDSDADEFIEYAVDGASRMKGLINDLLAYSRVSMQSEPFEPVDCNVVLEYVLGDLRLAIEENDAVITHDSLPTIIADSAQFGQIFLNLVSNAIKFRSDEPPAIHIGVTQADGEWLFSVRDNGIGIDPQYVERVFAIFQRLHTRKEYPGSGIGLAVCKKIVERHGGRIWLKSQPNQGTTFYFTIPTVSEIP